MRRCGFKHFQELLGCINPDFGIFGYRLETLDGWEQFGLSLNIPWQVSLILGEFEKPYGGGAEVFSVIQLTLDGITEALANGKGVEFREFGVFTTRLTKQRVGRNPKKPAETVVIPPRAIVKFKSGKIMKARVLERTAQLAK